MADDWEETEDDVEEILRRQDEAMALLERLRAEEPFVSPRGGSDPQGRRDFRRWPTPAGVTVELHDGERWKAADIVDVGTGGVCLRALPGWIKGPVPARLKSPDNQAVIALSDVMWRDRDTGKAGLRFEFLDNEERELWSDSLIDALLARYALG